MEIDLHLEVLRTIISIALYFWIESDSFQIIYSDMPGTISKHTASQIPYSRDLKILIERFDVAFLSRSCDSGVMVTEVQRRFGPLHFCWPNIFKICHLDPFLSQRGTVMKIGIVWNAKREK
jgi:hypothetical protein